MRPMHKWTDISSSSRDFLYPGFHPPHAGLIDNNFFSVLVKAPFSNSYYTKV